MAIDANAFQLCAKCMHEDGNFRIGMGEEYVRIVFLKYRGRTCAIEAPAWLYGPNVDNALNERR